MHEGVDQAPSEGDNQLCTELLVSEAFQRSARSMEYSMLFHVKHTHSWEACPYHDADRAKETIVKAIAGITESDAELVGAYADAPAHTIFLVLEATSATQIEEA
ncbi:MAG: hypothetical protein DRJ28_09965, partial [Actinobacteria bacterium]